jgi:hypothetical protein
MTLDVTMAGYVLRGSCGERLLFAAQEVLQPARVPEGACQEYRKRALASFGPLGRRILVDAGEHGQPMVQTPEENWLPEWGLGRRPPQGGRMGSF